MTTPLRIPRLVLLFLLFAFGIVGGAVGISALVKSHKQKDDLRKSIPSSINLSIDTSDVMSSGTAATVFCFVLAALAVVSAATLRRAAQAHGAVLALVSAGLFGALVAFDHFFATRSAKVSASIGGVALPDSTVKQAEQALGTTSVYKDIDYLRLVAILPWFAFLFGILAAGAHFAAGRSPASKREASAIS